MSRFNAGLLLIALIAIGTYFGFTKAIPFQSHFEIKADFRTSNNLKPNSFVRIAGVNVGKVTDIQPIHAGQPGARVTLRIDDKGLPIHKDASATIRPRIFLEGNFFVDLQPGTPSAPTLGDGDVIAMAQNKTPVQLDQILTSLQSDTRRDLQILLRELSSGLYGNGQQGAKGYNRSIQYWLDAFKGTAIVSDATLGQQPHDLSGYVSNAATASEALDRSPAALKGLITDFNTTARAFAVEQAALEQTIAELPRTLRAAQPALAALNTAFPPLRRLVADLRPATRSSLAALDAGIPFAQQVRKLVSLPELRGLVADLRPTVPNLVKLNTGSIPLLDQTRLASSCQNEVILPWANDRVPDSLFPASGTVAQESAKGLVGLGGESRSGDANGQWARVLAANGQITYALGSDPTGLTRFAQTTFPILGINPIKSARPPSRYDVPCETQQRPDLRTIPGQAPTPVSVKSAPTKLTELANAAAYESAAKIIGRQGYLTRAKTLLAKGLSIRKAAGLIGATLRFAKNGRMTLQMPKLGAAAKALTATGTASAGGKG
jgi:virulence factor Mce-like protein